MKLKSNCRYALVVPSSMGVRLTPQAGQPVHASHTFLMHATSAETNVASVSAYLGLPVKVLTRFVKGSPIAQLIKNNLASRHMHFDGPEVEKGGPWGFRHQINIADSGAGARGPRVDNDRAGEVGRTLSIDDFNLQRLFVEDGVQMIHLSGLIAALSPQSGEFCLELVRTAKENGTRISFDLNYRASFWQNREKALGELFSEIAGLADVLVGNEEDFQLCLGIQGPAAGGAELSVKIDHFKMMIEKAKKHYPNAAVFATTLRQVIDANAHLWGAIMAVGNNWYVIEPRPITVLDRIGGGDGFVGGLLYGLLRGWEPEKWLQFGWACGALATTLLTDYCQPADEAQIWQIWQGNARVQR